MYAWRNLQIQVAEAHETMLSGIEAASIFLNYTSTQEGLPFEIGQGQNCSSDVTLALLLDKNLAWPWAIASGQQFLRRNYPAAEQAACEALRRNPKDTIALNNLGAALLEEGRYEDSVSCLQQAIKGVRRHNHLTAVSSKRLAELWDNLGRARFHQRRFGDADFCFRKALMVKRDHTESHWLRAQTLLLRGRFEQGWQEFEHRWEAGYSALPSVSTDRWDGTPLNGRSILLRAEGGLGDTIQLIRYARSIQQMRGTVIVECQPRLGPLLKRVAGVDQVVSAGTLLPDHDVHVPMMSLPLLFNTTLKTIPSQPSYLTVDKVTIERWRKRIGRIGKLKIGMAWACGDSQSPRSLPLHLLAPLAGLADVALFSLQRGPAAAEIQSSGFSVVNLEKQAGEITDTAAAILNLDLIVCVDTMVAHLAGALGKPVWTLLPFVPDWRWLLGRTDSPWYPSMRLFRQPRPGDWKAVIRNVKTALSSWSV